MRVGVAIRRLHDERAGRGHAFTQLRARLLEAEPFDEGRAGQVAPVTANRVHDRQLVALADNEVFLAVRRRRVHRTGTRLERDMLAQDHRHLFLEEGMLQREPFERLALEAREHRHGARVDAVARGAIGDEIGGKHQRARRRGVGPRHRNERVVDLAAECDRLVGGQSPGGGGPDDDRRGRRRHARAEPDARRKVRPVGHRERDVDRDRGLVLVLDFSLGERGATVETPVHGLRALVEMAVGDDAAESADLLRFERGRHGHIGTVPVAEHA